jgi:uncharacterized membrane protein
LDPPSGPLWPRFVAAIYLWLVGITSAYQYLREQGIGARADGEVAHIGVAAFLLACLLVMIGMYVARRGNLFRRPAAASKTV